MNTGRCGKCTGMIAESYDVRIQEWYRYCINCGARPDVVARRKDGLEIGSPGICQTCKEHPRVSVKYPNKGVIWTALCQFCRVKYLIDRRKRVREKAKSSLISRQPTV